MEPRVWLIGLNTLARLVNGYFKKDYQTDVLKGPLKSCWSELEKRSRLPECVINRLGTITRKLYAAVRLESISVPAAFRPGERTDGTTEIDLSQSRLLQSRAS